MYICSKAFFKSSLSVLTGDAEGIFKHISWGVYDNDMHLEWVSNVSAMIFCTAVLSSRAPTVGSA